ncbi:MAG: VWA domain-containing protein, partial [Clostridia bacterium]|nr:VWA domain-containing protein [Clostridia bacterium]
MAEGNLYNDFSTWGAQDAYKNTLQPYIVFDNGSDDGYYLARVESDGKDVIGAGSDTHNHINLYINGTPAVGAGDVIVYETDMYFESDIISGLYFGLNIRNDSGAVKTAMDYDVSAKLPIGKWFRFTMIADFDTNMAYYYADGELISTRDKLVRGDTDPETTTYALHTLRWQFYQATISHGQSVAFDNVYVNIYKTADIGTYVPGNDTLEGFEKATPYSLREVVPIAKIDGEPYYTAESIKNKLSTSLKPVMIEILRDSNAALSIACDATIQTNGIEILIDTPEGSQMTGPDENGFIEVDVPYTPAYTVESDGFAASFIKNNGDKSINILKGCYGSVDYFASDSKITPYAGGDSYLKVTPVKDTAIGGDVEEVRIYYTDRYYLEMNDFYVIDFDVATESEFADMCVIPVMGHSDADNGNKVGETQLSITEKEMVVPIELTLDERGFHELAFKISQSDDTSEKNNTYHTYVSIQQFNKILLIERHAGESAAMQEIFGDNYDLTTLSIEYGLSEIPRTIEELAEYEQVILVNIAYSDMPAGFEELLHRYVYNLGGGLFTVGGINDGTVTNPIPHAYNREDLEKSTYYKQMLPISAIDFTPPAAVMIVVDSSGSMTTDAIEGKTKYDLALDGATACLDTLGDRDYCGIVSFQSTANEKMQLIPVAQKEKILEIIDDMRVNQDAGDTIFSGAIIRAGEALSVLDNVEKKHIIMVTDGMPSDKIDVYGEYIKDNFEKGITMSIITVGDTGDNYKNSMAEAAAMGGGKHHHVNDTKSIPTIMQTAISLEAIDEIEYGEPFDLTIKDKTSVVKGIDDASLPTLSGYYGTVKKADAVVPLMGKYVPIYAQWKYGNGNVGSFMSDLNGEWSEAFVNDLVGQAIITNIVSSIFPMNDVVVNDIGYE